ncbi:MAG TPA: DUF4139 domain-containing protein [Firmicutes bacterium]|nr:DUF4139 domain-containing protein [Bacillota bacterium]
MRQRGMCLIVITACLVVGAMIMVTGSGGYAASQAREISGASRQGLYVTVYNNGLALIKDRREIALDQGLNLLKFCDIAELIDPTSVHFKSLSAPGNCTLLEQNYEYDLINREKLLQNYIGKQVILNNDGITQEGTLLAFADGKITLEVNGKILIDPPGKIELPRLPSGLITKPTLVWHLKSKTAMKHLVEVTYLTRGLSWRADYVAGLDASDKFLDLTGWVSINNESGASYPDATVKLVAGDVNIVGERAVRAMAKAQPAGGTTQQFDEKGFFEYHMYTLNRPTTLNSNQLKQLELLTANRVPVKKLYLFEWSSDPRAGGVIGQKQVANARVFIQFTNAADSGLGMPLPAGRIRIYKSGDDGNLEFIGEDEIKHTAKDEKVTLYLGNAFDIVGERTITDYRKTGANSYEQACSIKLRNHKQEDIEVVVHERFYGDWTLTSPAAWKKIDSGTAEFRVKVPKGKEAEILYKVKVTQ